MIKVKAANPETITFWETDPAHPGGEVFVAGDKVVEVGETPAVHRRIASGELVVVGAKAPETEVEEVEEAETPADDATAGKRKRK